MLSLVSGLALAVLSNRRLVVDSSQHVSKLSQLFEAPGFDWEHAASEMWNQAHSSSFEFVFHSQKLNSSVDTLCCGDDDNELETGMTHLDPGDGAWQQQRVVAVDSDQYFLPLVLANRELAVCPCPYCSCYLAHTW